MSATSAVMAAIPSENPTRRRPRRADDPARLPGLDARTAPGKRFTAIAAAIVAEYPGADVGRVRELALLRLSIELRQAKLLTSDNPAQSDELVRLSNLAARRERDLRARRKAAPAGPSLLEKALAKHARKEPT